MELRPYQREALAAALEAMRMKRFVLLQAATGAGKTILFSALIRHCMERYRMRIGVIAHREVLVRQAYDKLMQVWPEGREHTGLACRSADRRVDIEAPVVVGSPQTLVGRLGDLPPLDLLILDECHRVPPANTDSQYRTLIDTLTGYYPELRVIGVTATPFRLGHGMIYGGRCRSGRKNWWDRLDYRVSIGTLQKQGYLVPLRAKEAENIDVDLESVRTDKGEYNTADLSSLMEKEIHVGSAINAYRRYGEGRGHVVVFAVTIRHAEILARAFRAAGYTAGCVHSGMSRTDRLAVLDDFESGRITVVCNVGVLTEGWDCPAADCALMCRPTLSPALYVQMIGRILRPSPGKTDSLLLDLSGNCRRHGDPDDPHVPLPSERQSKKKKEPRMKTCEACGELVLPAVAVCPACGREFPAPEVVEINAPVTMREVTWAPRELRVLSCAPSLYQSRAGNLMLKLTILARSEEGGLPVTVNHYLDVEGNSGDYGRSKARLLWRRLAGTDLPDSVTEAAARAGELRLPERITVKPNGKYLNIVKW